jgi:predicted metal-dependent hydrolase
MWFSLKRKYRIVRRRITLKGRRAQYLAHREAARSLAHARVGEYAKLYDVTIKKVFIKNLKSRWGSCSSKGNLNFHYKISLLPPELANYVIAHEVCHLREFNHSPKFWALLAESTPNWRLLRRKLRLIH